MLSDLRFAFRQLRKSPGFTAVAVLTLALGIGANTTFFSVLYGVVLKPLPLPRAAELVEIKNVGPALGGNLGRVSIAELRDYRAHLRSFVGIGSHSIGRVTLDRPDGAERVLFARVTANLFPLLGVAPALGRAFDETEEQPGRDRVVVISHAFWQTQFAGAPDIVGRTVRFNGAPHTIVGVMPAGFVFENPSVALWQPLDFSPRGKADRDEHFLPAIARLAPGVSLARAADELRRVAQELRAGLPDAYPPEPQWTLGAVPLRESRFGHLSTPLGALMAAASAVLLIACVNVAIMFLLRAAVRHREMMIRLSLGAGRRHIIRQLLAESIVVCSLGTLGGMLIAVIGVEILKAFPPADIPRLAEVSLNFPVAAFSAAILLLVTLLVGLAPAFVVLRSRVVIGLAHAARVTESRSAVRLREALTVVEIALAVMLLVGGGLAVQNLRNLLRDDLGFTTAQLFTFKTNLTPQAYPDLASTSRFYDQISAKLADLPGVAAVAGVSYLPLSGESQFQAAAPVGLEAPEAGSRSPSVAWRVVRGPYFSTMGTSLLLGRFFDERDQANAPLVAIVDDTFARRFWSDEAAALGQSVRFGEGAQAQVRTIVGIVHRQKHNGPGQESIPGAFVPLSQTYMRGMYTVLKLQGAPTGLAAMVRTRLAEVDPTIPMYFVETMERRYASTLAMPRFAAGLIGAFAMLALILAAVGIFGVTAYAVAQRSREFGIRFAIGAPRSHIVGLVLGRVGRLAVIGGAAGGFAAYHLAHLMTGFLSGVAPADLPTLAVAAATISFTALAASLVPLIRALRINPVEALRAE
jgi:putative ABC transport system permease protein